MTPTYNTKPWRQALEAQFLWKTDSLSASHSLSDHPDAPLRDGNCREKRHQRRGRELRDPVASRHRSPNSPSPSPCASRHDARRIATNEQRENAGDETPTELDHAKSRTRSSKRRASARCTSVTRTPPPVFAGSRTAAARRAEEEPPPRVISNPYSVLSINPSLSDRFVDLPACARTHHRTGCLFEARIRTHHRRQDSHPSNRYLDVEQKCFFSSRRAQLQVLRARNAEPAWRRARNVATS